MLRPQSRTLERWRPLSLGGFCPPTGTLPVGSHPSRGSATSTSIPDGWLALASQETVGAARYRRYLSREEGRGDPGGGRQGPRARCQPGQSGTRTSLYQGHTQHQANVASCLPLRTWLRSSTWTFLALQQLPPGLAGRREPRPGLGVPRCWASSWRLSLLLASSPKGR